MNRPATVEATQADQGAPFTREAIIGVLDKAPDGYKLLAKLVDDPYELLRDYNPDFEVEAPASTGNGRERTQLGKLEAQLRGWLVATLRHQGWQVLGGVPSN